MWIPFYLKYETVDIDTSKWWCYFCAVITFRRRRNTAGYPVVDLSLRENGKKMGSMLMNDPVTRHF